MKQILQLTTCEPKKSKILNNFKISCLSAFLVSFTASAPLSNYYIPRSANSIVSCDINSDNFNDLIIAHVTNWNYTNPTISVLQNNGYGLYAISDTSWTFCGGGHGNIIATRMNNDNFSDIVISHTDWSTGVAQNFVRILYNNGQGNFTTFKDFPINSADSYMAITSGDFNGDSIPDLAFIENVPQKWAVMYNDDQGNLSAPVYYNISYLPQDIASGDLDGNGMDDIVIAGPTDILYSTSTGFQRQVLNINSSKIHVADMNNDGKKDIVTLNVLAGTTISIIENLGEHL